MKNKRCLIGLVLAAMLCMAFVSYVIYSAEAADVGGAAGYSVTIPKAVTLGADKRAVYSVKVDGYIPAGWQVCVEPVDGIADTEACDFYMSYSSSVNPKADVVAVINQSKTQWTSAEVAAGYEETDNSITAEGISAGSWMGTFQMAISTRNLHTHSYTLTSSTATCTAAGVNTYTCGCGDSYTENVSIGEHNYVENNTLLSWSNTSNGTYKFVQSGTTWTSNNKGVSSSTATSTWTIDVAEAAVYPIKYKVSSEPTYDKFTLKLDSTTIANAIHGAGSELTYTATLTAGRHTLTATYSKDGSVDKNDDRAYVVLADIAGKNNHKCTVCGLEADHSYTETITRQPTCTEAGEKAYICACGKIGHTEIVPAGHNYSTAITKEPTCTEAGVKTYTCACGDRYTETILPTVHNYKAVAGMDSHKCAACGLEEGHSYNAEVTTETTCTTDGVKTYTCVCGDRYTETIAAAHNYVENNTLPSWNNASNGTYKFVRSGTTWLSNNNGVSSSTATSTWTIDVAEATVYPIKYMVSSETNYDKFTLILDSTTIANAISGAGSELTYTAALTAGRHTLTATYTKDGSTNANNDCAYVVLADVGKNNHKCTVCGLEGEHDYIKTVKQATCTEAGEEVYTCACGKSYTETIPAGHILEGNVCIVCGKTGTYLLAPEGAISYWNYTLDDANNIVTLNYYVGSQLDVIVYESYPLNGKTYTTRLKSNSSSATETTAYMFNGNAKTNCKYIRSIKFSNAIDTSSMTNMEYMFYNCSKLTALDLSGFDTSKVTGMGCMFQNCTSLTTLDLSGFDTSKVTGMGYMFQNCTSLTTLNLSGWDTSNVWNMEYMFQNCTSLTTLNLSGWDTSNVWNMEYMFYECSSLTTVTVCKEHFKIASSIELMFSRADKLAGNNQLNSNDSTARSKLTAVDCQGCLNPAAGRTGITTLSLDRTEEPTENSVDDETDASAGEPAGNETSEEAAGDGFVTDTSSNDASGSDSPTTGGPVTDTPQETTGKGGSVTVEYETVP